MSRKVNENSTDSITENEAEITTEKVENKAVTETVKATVEKSATTTKKEPRMGIYQYLLRYKVENQQVGNLMRILYKKGIHTPSEWRQIYEKLCRKKISTSSLNSKNI